jgi:hypothetical protein
MAVPFKRGSRLLAMFALAMLAAPNGARADEIRLKGGRKLYGVIVAYEDNMFKIKTDFGYELIEKDKIESIIPSTPSAKSEQEKKEAAKKDAPKMDAKPESAVATGSEVSTAATNANAKTIDPAPPGKTDKSSPKITNAAVKPDAKPQATAANATAPVMKDAPPAVASTVTANPAAPAPPKEPEVPANKEEIQGNLYVNYTHGFRMYKAPSWNLIEEARGALPNAIVAMGTANESTLLVVGEEKTKDALETAASTVEKRLHEVYLNYQRLSERKTTVGGQPAVEYQYRGKADEHDWSGRLVVVSRGKDIFTVLAMTYADTDLIQIQENVIARAIASLDFTTH